MVQAELSSIAGPQLVVFYLGQCFLSSYFRRYSQTKSIKRLIEVRTIKSRRDGQKDPGGYSRTLPIRVCAAQRGRDVEAPDLERGIHFRRVF